MNIYHTHCYERPIHDGLDFAPIDQPVATVILLNDGRELLSKLE